MDPETPQGDPAQTPTAESGTDSGQSNNTLDAAALQAQLDKLQKQLTEANKESADRRHKLKQLEDEKLKKEREGLDENGRLKAELDDLKKATATQETLSQEAEALRTAVQAQVEAVVKELDIPAHIQTLLEAMSPADKLKYLAENRKHFIKTAVPVPNINAADKGKGGKQRETEEQKQARLKKRYPSLKRRN